MPTPATLYKCSKCGTTGASPVLPCGCGVAVTASIAATAHGSGGLKG